MFSSVSIVLLFFSGLRKKPVLDLHDMSLTDCNVPGQTAVDSILQCLGGGLLYF